MAESLISASISGKSGGGSIVEVGTFTKDAGVSKVIEGSILFVFTDKYSRYYSSGKYYYGLGPCACFCEVGTTGKEIYDLYCPANGDPSYHLILTIGYSSDFTVSIQSNEPTDGAYLVLG